MRQTLSLVLTFLMIQQTDAKTSHTKRNVPIIVRVGVAVAAIRDWDTCGEVRTLKTATGKVQKHILRQRRSAISLQ